jgi:hypothetical protein
LSQPKAHFAALIALGLAACASATAQTETPLTIPLTPLRERLRTVEVGANGATGTFLFDSAGGVTMVSPAFAERAHCTPAGRGVGFRMNGERLDTPLCRGLGLDVGGRHWTPRQIGVFDVSPYLAPGQTAPDGNLALDAFEGRAVTLDVAHNALIVETPASLAARINGAVEVPMRLSRESQGASLSANIGVPGPDGLAWFELDSGNGGTVLVSKHIAAAFHLDPNGQGPQQLELDIAPGIHLSTDRAIATDLILDGNLGMPFLSRFVVTFDLAHERAWVRPV